MEVEIKRNVKFLEKKSGRCEIIPNFLFLNYQKIFCFQISLILNKSKDLPK